MSDPYPFTRQPVWQHTLCAPVSCGGVGLHTGKQVQCTLQPSPVDTGLVFARTDVRDKDPVIRLHPGAVCQTRRGTCIGNADGVTIATVEHLLAALSACGVDNALIELTGAEVPAMDGSAKNFARIIAQAGLQQQTSRRRYIEILEPLEVQEGAKCVRLEPSNVSQIDARINYPGTLIGEQNFQFETNASGFIRDIAPARTFVLAHEVKDLQQADFALGGSLENCLVVDGMTLQNETGLRFADEFVRHKILDISGDLALAGAPILGRFISNCAGHSLNNAVLLAMQNEDTKWRWTELP